MTDPTRPPLWRHMEAARHDRPLSDDPVSAEMSGHLYAAEIRSIADEMVMRFDPWLTEHAEVAEWLRAEADRAERGDD